jgi:hypothetical protein
VLSAVAAVGAPALAAAVARATAAPQVTAGSWGAAAGPTGGPAVRGDYVVRFQQGTPIPPQYFEVFNTGTLRLTGQTYKAVNVRPLNGNAPPTVSLDACVGGRWEQTTSICLGGTVQNLTNTDLASSTVTLALPVGAAVHVRAAPSRLANYPLEYQTVVTVTVARSQAAAGRTVTS